MEIENFSKRTFDSCIHLPNMCCFLVALFYDIFGDGFIYLFYDYVLIFII